MRSRIQILLSLSALLLAWQPADAQVAPADDFFHGGAQFYLSNNIPAALERVETGLKIYPDDIKLKKLEELLKQQQQQQQQQKNQDQNQQQKQDQDKQDQQKNEQQQSKQDQEQKQKQSQDQQQSKQSTEEQQQEQPVAAGQMTEQQAKQLLDAQKGHEQVLIFKPAGEKDKARKKTLKDW